MGAVRLIKNVPIYSSLVYTYIAEGKLKGILWALLIDSKNLDYNALCREKLKQLDEWMAEKHLDFIELIWPFYCRTLQFLKKAHFI